MSNLAKEYCQRIAEVQSVCENYFGLGHPNIDPFFDWLEEHGLEPSRNLPKSRNPFVILNIDGYARIVCLERRSNKNSLTCLFAPGFQFDADGMLIEKFPQKINSIHGAFIEIQKSIYMLAWKYDRKLESARVKNLRIGKQFNFRDNPFYYDLDDPGF